MVALSVFLHCLGLKIMIDPSIWHDVWNQEQISQESATSKDLEHHEFRNRRPISYNLSSGSYIHESSQISRLVYPDGFSRRAAQAATKS
jgi:hypothetical protein